MAPTPSLGISVAMRAMAAAISLRHHMLVFGAGRGALYALGWRRGRRVRATWAGSPYPVQLRAGTSDVTTFFEVLLNGEYDFDMKTPASIIDAGANVGLASVWFACRFPEARILAVEAERSNYELLRDNVASFPNVIPMHAAVWSHRGVVAVEHGSDRGSWSFHTKEVGGGGVALESVPSYTVGDLAAQHDLGRIGLLKVDIEGAEKEVFTAPEEWIPSVEAIVVELHDRLVPGCARTFFAAVEAFPAEVVRGNTYYVARA